MQHRVGRTIGSIAAAFAVALATVVVSAGSAGAVVVNDEDSLRTALANDAETSIVLAADIVVDDCPSGPLERSSTVDLVIEGNGFSITETCGDENLTQTETGRVTLNRVTLIGGVVGVETDGPLVMNGSVITKIVGSGGAAGVVATDVPVTMADSVIDSVTADSIAYGVLTSTGAVTVTNSRITGIEAEQAFGAGSQGGVVTVTGSRIDSLTGADVAVGAIADAGVTVDTSVIRDIDGGVAVGAYSDDGTVLVRRSTIAAVTTKTEGGAAVGAFGAIIDVENSTITGVLGPALYGERATVVYSDIVGNGGAIEAGEVAASGLFGVGPLATEEGQLWTDEVALFGSVVTDPLNGAANCSSEAVVTSQGYNFADDTSCGLTATGDRQGAGLDPLLGPLADNGGPTPTLLPQTASPLLEAIPAGACRAGPAAGIAIDQRGEPRPGFVSCDIGSVELQPAPVIEPTFTG